MKIIMPKKKKEPQEAICTQNRHSQQSIDISIKSQRFARKTSDEYNLGHEQNSIRKNNIQSEHQKIMGMRLMELINRSNKRKGEIEKRVCCVVYTIKGERINRRVDDGDDGNPISSNLQDRASLTHYAFVIAAAIGNG